MGRSGLTSAGQACLHGIRIKRHGKETTGQQRRPALMVVNFSDDPDRMKRAGLDQGEEEG